MSAEFSNPFTPNVPIQLADLTELPAFEDMVAQVVDPDMTPTEKLAWEGRVHIRELVRIPTARGRSFNGRLADIELTPLEDPYERLLTAKEDGWQFTARRGGVPISSSIAADNERLRFDNCLGFHLTADAKSSGRGTIGEFQAGLWYVPVTTRVIGRVHRVSAKRTDWNGGSSVMRIVTKPRIERENFIRPHKESVRIAFSALTNAARRAARRERER